MVRCDGRMKSGYVMYQVKSIIEHAEAAQYFAWCLGGQRSTPY